MEQQTGIYRQGMVKLSGPSSWPEGIPVRVMPCGVPVNPETVHDGHVIIGGLGLAGHFVLEWCRKQGLTVCCVDENADTVERIRKSGTTAILGDIREKNILLRARLSTALAVAVMIPNEQQMLEAVRIIREMNPSVLIFARSNFNKTAQEAKLLGADEVVDQEGLVAYEIISRLVGRLAPVGK